jgi:hypothetical protein
MEADEPHQEAKVTPKKMTQHSDAIPVRQVRQGVELENTIKLEIRNISDFKICLESVKFPLQ